MPSLSDALGRRGREDECEGKGWGSFRSHSKQSIMRNQWESVVCQSFHEGCLKKNTFRFLAFLAHFVPLHPNSGWTFWWELINTVKKKLWNSFENAIGIQSKEKRGGCKWACESQAYTTAFGLEWVFIKSIFHTGFPTTDFLNLKSHFSPLEQQYFLQYLQQSKYFWYHYYSYYKWIHTEGGRRQQIHCRKTPIQAH